MWINLEYGPCAIIYDMHIIIEQCANSQGGVTFEHSDQPIWVISQAVHFSLAVNRDVANEPTP